MTTPTCRAALADERAKFEAWYRATFKTPSFLSDGVGGYHSDLTERAWLAWAAARSALALEAATVPGGTLFVLTDEKRYLASAPQPQDTKDQT